MIFFLFYIFFFIFLIIFPDADKTEKTKAAKLEAAKAALESAKSSGGEEEIARAQAAYDKAALAYEIAAENKKVFHSEKNISSAKSLAEAKINGYQGKLNKIAKLGKAAEEASAKGDTAKAEKLEAEKKEIEAGLEKSRNEALEAVASRDEIVPVEEAVLAEVKEAREKRAKAA